MIDQISPAALPVKTNFSQESKSSKSTSISQLRQARPFNLIVGSVRGMLGLLSITAMLCLASSTARAQGTTTVTSNPANGATGVPASTTIVFTFSAAMDTANTTASFYSISPFGSYPVLEAWNAANTVLTCTPQSPLPLNVTISWIVSGQDAAANPVDSQGSFTTGTGGGGGTGSGTNAITTFSAGKLYFYQQVSTAAPTPVPTSAYGFLASTSLASNQAATAVTLTTPVTSAPANMTQNPLHHEDYSFFAFTNNQSTFESIYPEGNYVFNVTGTPANVQGTVTLPTTMLQPNAPRLTNFLAAQSINVSQPFTLHWSAFQNGTTADFITVSVDNGASTIFQTPSPGTNGALNGTVTSVTIPAGTLAAGSTNTADITFYHVATTTNSSLATVAYRATTTKLSLIAASSTTAQAPVVSNPTVGPSGFSFIIATSLNQSLIVRHSTDLASWQTLLTTNSPGVSFQITVPIQAGGKDFFRVENGP